MRGREIIDLSDGVVGRIVNVEEGGERFYVDFPDEPDMQGVMYMYDRYGISWDYPSMAGV